MKLRSALLAAALLVPACAGAGEFDAYRIPEHTWRSGSVALAGRYSHDSHTQDAPYSAAGVSSDGASALGLSFARGYDSDRFQHAWSVDARGSLVGSTADERNETLAQAMNSWSGDASGSCRIWGNIRAYPEKRDLGMDLSAFFFASSGESRGRLDQRQFTPPVAGRYETRLSNQGNSYQYSGIARITLGHGIVRDATVVEDVHILESRLLAAGTLSRPLTPAGRARLAELLTVTPSLSFEHDRPERFEWREVERILREDGALSGGSLDAYGVLRAMEPYLSVSSQRRSGHFAGLAATFDHDHQILRTSVRLSSRNYAADSLIDESEGTVDNRYTESMDRVYVGVVGEWHRPSGWRVQWDLAGQALVPARAGERGLIEQVDLTAEWHVADRWQVTGGVLQARNYLEQGSREDSTPHDFWETALAGQLDYYIEDNLSVRLAVYDVQLSNRASYLPFGGPYDEYERNGTVQLGVSYRFLGRISSPGLFERMPPLQ